MDFDLRMMGMFIGIMKILEITGLTLVGMLLGLMLCGHHIHISIV